ncbi:MAG TPA: DUF3822 family protein [Chitinophagaceae bacterium]
MSSTIQLHTVFTVEDPKIISETDLTTCDLLMLVGHQHFSYALLEGNHMRFIGLKSYSFPAAGTLLEEVEQVFGQDKLLFTAFRQTRIAFDSPRQTLVPAALYTADSRREHLQLLYGPGEDEVVMSDSIPEADILNVYAVDRNLAGYLKKEFGVEKIYHAQTALLKAVIKEQAEQDDPFLLLQVQQQKFTAVVFSGGQLQYQQQLPYQTGMDIVYHVLNIAGQLQIDPQQITVLLGGEIMEESQLYQELYRFISKLKWLNRPASFHYIEKFNAYPSQHFYNLFALALCE